MKTAVSSTLVLAVALASSGSAQSRDKMLAEAIVYAHLTATDHLMLLPQREGLGHFVHAQSDHPQGCATAWRGLSLWTVGLGAGRPWRVAVVAGRPFLVSVPSGWEAFVDALLRAGRTDGHEPTVRCLTETLALSIAVRPSDELLLTKAPSAPRGNQEVEKLNATLPEGWPAPVVYELGDDSVSVFTLFQVSPSHFSRQAYLVRPVGYALVFDAQRRLVTWTSREGGTIEVPVQQASDTGVEGH